MARKSVPNPEPNTEANAVRADVCPPVPSLPPKRGLRLPEAALYSGLTVWFLRNLCWERKIPFIQEGKAYVILRDHLDEYLENRCYKVRA